MAARDVFSLYVRDLGVLLTEKLTNAGGPGVSPRQETDAFESGRRFGLMEAVSLMQQQADAFGIARSQAGLPEDDVDSSG